jgi:hypothetical protein
MTVFNEIKAESERISFRSRCSRPILADRAARLFKNTPMNPRGRRHFLFGHGVKLLKA